MKESDNRLFELLNQLEGELKRVELWQVARPSEEALQSSQPFALDTLAPEQWLQWIFLPKMREAIKVGAVPRGFVISSYFEQVWQGNAQHIGVVSLTKQIDEQCKC